MVVKMIDFDKGIHLRRCPNCLGPVRFLRKKGATAHSSSSIVICTVTECHWKGKFYNSIPFRKHGQRSNSVREKGVIALSTILDFQVGAQQAISRAEEMALSNNYADPDPDAAETLQSYVNRIGYLMFLRSMLALSNLDEDQRKIVLENEIHYTFPRTRAVRIQQ